MIAYIKGKLEEIQTDSIILDREGMGIRVLVPTSVLSNLPKKGEEVKLHTYFHIREDAMQLFGFFSEEDYKLFKLLITVNGVGPKAALSILSSMSTDTLTFAILSEDIKTISKAQGVGKKIAQKIVVEIKDKVGLIHEGSLFEHEGEFVAAEVSSATHKERNEAIEVLKALGYSSADALKAVNSVSGGDGITSDEIVKQALKIIQ